MSTPPPMQLEVEVGDDSMEEDPTDMIPGDVNRQDDDEEKSSYVDDVVVSEPPDCNLDRFTLPARAEAVVDQWRAKLADGSLTPAHFQDHWRLTVPRIYSPQPNRTCLDWSFDEELASQVLIKPLEQFVWGCADGAPPAPRRSTLCGRVFKQGEPAYSCRECGMDNTCVLCVECFKVSEHRHHKYKMGQSNGGGCCDCGDAEAWRRAPFCQLHAAPADGSSGDSATSPDVVARMKVVASVCLAYCFRLLTHDHSPGLPNDLRLKDDEKDPLQILDQPDCYCTVLYNDETHTFEQVISTLTRVTKCNHRDSVELVSLIDREGRALVKCNSFQVCDKLKSDIEMRTAMLDRFTSRHGPSLKVMVMHAHLVAHQTYAMKLLAWLQSFVSQEPSLRLAVSQVALGDCWASASSAVSGGGGVAAGVMQNDCRMWKSARTAWHRLLIATTLMDYETKRTMAVLFTKNYGSMLKDFIRDDHDHSFSISSLSVQLYTTPTLAHHLIARHDALFIILNTFVSECNRKCNSKGRLEFDRNHVSTAFKRAQFMLYDVKYLLGAVPTSFDDDLRKGFLHGLSLMLNLLVMMQGMDSVVRQVGQHTEYEPEWEGAFNLHVKLAHSLTLALEWCGADRTLVASAYRTTLRRLFDAETFEPRVVRELGGQSASVIPYDVASQPVSIHRPLSRFAAGLHLLLHRHGLHYHSRELARADKPRPCPEELIEPVLRTSVMIAQVHAGMWRRNGFALLNQLYFYHNVKCRAEMLDRDIVMLQIGASLIESNEFVIHLLNKFNLLEWCRPDFESRGVEDDALRHTATLVEEMLGLLVTVVGARYVPGVGEVTAEDRTKKEIIQMLCVKPMPHSELNRSLPEDQLHETGLESVISEVADFSKPSGGSNRGMYTLKEHLYDEYDTFFYHYTREDLSRSEEAQRARRKAKGLPECCPPPALPQLSEPFRLLASLLQCDAAVHVLRTVLERALDLRARSFSEAQVHKALHLMGYALRDEESGHYEFLSFAESARRAGVLALLDRLAVSPRVDAHKALAQWLLAKMRSLLGISEEGSGDAEKMETDQQEKPTSDEAADTEKARRAKLAAERRAKLMAQMQAAQNNFISKNATLFETTTTEPLSVEGESKGVQCGAALGVWGGGGSEAPRVCIMCQEEARVDLTSEPLVLVAFVQHSTVLRRGASCSGEGGAILPAGVGASPHISSCGHAMHAACCRKYVDSVVDKENRRPYRLRQPAAFDVEKREYLCPLCERLCNTELPLLPGATPPTTAPPPLSEQQLRNAVRLVLQHQVSSEPVHICTESCEDMHCTARARSVGAASSDMDTGDAEPDEAPALLQTHAHALLPNDVRAHFSEAPPAYGVAARALLADFVTMIPGVCGERHAGGVASLGALYRATSYTVMATDALIQAEHRPLLGEMPSRLRDALQALIRVAAVLPCVWEHPQQLAHHALTTLDALENTSPLLLTAFGVIVPLVLTTPCIFAKQAGPARPTHLARQLLLEVFRSNIFRALLVVDVEKCTKMDDGEVTNTDLENLLPFVKELRRGNLNEEAISANAFWESVKEQCMRFLRCCCLFFYFLSDVTPPAELTVAGGETFESMCGYLDMPCTYKELVDTSFAKEKFVEWATLSNEWIDGNIDPDLVMEPAEPPDLVKLPEDFSELMNIVSEFTCPNSEREDSKYPTMCLVCGQLLCSQSYCCQQEITKVGRGGVSSGTEHAGAAVAHALLCCAGAGILLRVRECEVLLLAPPHRGAMLPAPYLDSYGETDQGLRRGNPLHLCPERYSALRTLWLGHGIHERIARALDTNMLVTTQWQNM